MGKKNLRSWCWFRIRWKSCKETNSQKVINEKGAEKWSFLLFLLCALFSTFKFFGDILELFWTTNSTSNFVFYDIHIEFWRKNVLLLLTLFSNFKAKNRWNGTKNKKVQLHLYLVALPYPPPPNSGSVSWQVIKGKVLAHREFAVSEMAAGEGRGAATLMRNVLLL